MRNKDIYVMMQCRDIFLDIHAATQVLMLLYVF